MLELNGIRKSFGKIEVLRGVDLEARAGEVHALLGENGAGKSTLMKILSGVVQPTSGEIVLDGEAIAFASSSQARDSGISIIHQELSLAPNMNVRDNIFMGREIMTATGVDFAEEERQTRLLMEELEEDIDPLTPVEDLRLGFHNVWKYHYTPGVHENVTIGEVVINGDVWKGLKPEHQEMMKSVAAETFVIWWAKWQRQNADAIKELQDKHGVRILRTPPDILIEFLKTWDQIAKEEGAKNPFFKKVHDSQRQYASLVVPAKRFMFPPYSFAANYYFPEQRKPAARAKAKAK